MPYSPLISKIRVHNPNKKGSAVANRNYAHYIATRAGVSLEEVDNIDDALSNDKILEMNLDENIVHQEASDEGYVRYMARRPRSHGLFGNIDTTDLDKVVQNVNELSKQGRIIYRGIISLSEKDGEELGFRNVNAWNNYLNRVMPDIAQKLGLSPTDHTWIAAFHAEESHPHVHYELWDNKDKVRSPYIHTSVQKDIRNMLSQEMFDDAYERSVRQVFQEQLSELKENRNRERSEILDQAKNLINEVGYVPGVEYERLPDKIQPEELKKIAQETSRLIDMLPKSGRLTYKFLPPEAKEQLTKLSGLIISRTDMQREISSYLNTIKEMHGYYGETKTEIKNAPLQGKADIEKRIKNALLREIVNSIKITAEKEPNFEFKENADVDMELHVNDVISIINQDYYIEWNDSYKNAMDHLYGENPDLEKGFDILEQEAIKRNAIAIEKIGNLIEKQIGNNIDVREADEFFVEARKAYQDVYAQTDNDYIKTYAAYKMGKMFDRGLGGEQDYKTAEKWYKIAGKNTYAQYSLAKIYLDNKLQSSSEAEIQKNKEQAFILMKKSAERKNAFAYYELGNMYAHGIGTNIDQDASDSAYKQAYSLFCEMTRKATDDSILYRVGKMTLDGIGTTKSVEKAIDWFKKAADLGNENAQYSLAKIYIEEKDFEKVNSAIKMLEKLAENNNMMAEYTLGSIYADYESQYYDLEKAIGYLERSAEQDNQFAEYKLGVIYADPEGQHYDLEKAISYLEQSVKQDNQFAEYKLGVIYADPEGQYYDLKKAISYLEQSAKQDNQFAEYKLGVIYADPEGQYYDLEKAISYLEQSAKQDNQFAEYKLGVIYADPERQHYDLEKAISYLEQSAKQDNQFAEYKLGVIYADPEGPHYDLEKAIRYFGQSAIQDNQSARYALGVIYADSEKPYYNLDVAITYFKKAAEQGNEYAQYKLGSIYTNPENKQYDIKKGIAYLEQAANKGNAYAQCKLGMIYYYGQGVDQNKEIGRKWLEKAAEQNNQMAKHVLDDTSLDMGMGISYALVKAALSSVESMNQQGQYQNRVAAQSITKNKSKTQEQVKARDFMPERL